MKEFTETYNAARLAEAKPIVLVYVSSDIAAYCFGKETPLSTHLDPAYNTLEWAARVLSFGDYSRRFSSDGKQLLLPLTEEEMSSYTVTCDNVDYYFSTLAGKEEFLGGKLRLVQGFDYPGFLYSDYQLLFWGTIDKFFCDTQQCLIRAQQSLISVDPEDPTIDLTTTYTLICDGTVGAYSDYSYATMDPIFYDDTSWEWVGEFSLDTAQEHSILKIENQAASNARVEIGVDANDKVFLTVWENVCSGSHTSTRYTSSVALPTTVSRYRVSVNYDATLDRLTISDNGEQESRIYGGSPFISHTTNHGSSGSGNGQYNGPQGVAVDLSDNIYIADFSNNRIQKFNSAMTWQANFTHGDLIAPTDVSVDLYGNVWATSQQTSKTIVKFDSSGALLDTFHPFDIAFAPDALACDPEGNVWIAESSKGAKKLSTYGALLASIPQSSHARHLNTVTCVDVAPDNSVWFGDVSTIKQYSSTGNFISSFAGYDVGGGFGWRGIFVDKSLIFTSEISEDKVHVYDYDGTFIEEFTPASAFDQPWGIIRLNNELYVADRLNDRVQELAIDALKDFDRCDNANNDRLYVGNTLDGNHYLQEWNGLWRLHNQGEAAAADYPDQIGTLEPTIQNGVWGADGDIQEITAEDNPEEPIDAASKVPLATTSRYGSPGVNQQNVILPLPYGNLIENSDEAVWVCPQIGTLTYCVAGWPIQSVAQGNTITVYVDGVLTAAGWTFDESDNFESQGNIATLTFSVDPGGIVSVRCNGKYTTKLLTNPVDIIEDWIAYAAGILGALSWETEPTSFTKGKLYCDDQSFVAAGVILSNNTLGFWIKTILASFFGSFRFNSAGKLEISFLNADYELNVVETLQEHEAIRLEATRNLENVVNQVISNYAISYAKIDRRYKNNALTSYFLTLDESETSTIEGAGKIELNLDWNRNTASVGVLHDILFNRFGEGSWTFQYLGQDFKFLIVDLLDHVTGTITLFQDSEGNVEQDALFELREITMNLDDFTTSLMCLHVPIDLYAREIWLLTQEIWIDETMAFLENEV